MNQLFLNEFDTTEFTIENQSNKYLDIKSNIFDEYDTLMVKSCTGTGKTFNTAYNVERYLKQNPQYNFMSIVDLRTLSNQHSQNFKNIKMRNYQTDGIFNGEKMENFNVCINSVFKFNSADKFENYIVYIDEINSFLKTLTHSKLLAINAKLIYSNLMRIIKTCHKLILSDAKINNKIRKFINKRKGKTIYIKNDFKKYQDVDAINIKNEELFLEQMETNIKNNKYFILGSDSCDKATNICNYLKDKFKDRKDDFLLITSESGYKPKDANEEFLNHFVFHSPSIKTGVDFSIDIKQDVFLYFNQKSVNSDDFFQIATRTRNINKMYYFIEDKRNEPKFENLEDVKKYFRKISNTNDKLVNVVSVNLNKDDEEEINENTYFELFCHQEFEDDIYKSNLKYYFEEILKENGFKLSTLGETQRIDYKKTSKMKKLSEDDKINNVEEFIKASDTDKLNNPKYERLINNMEFLNIEKDNIKEFMFILSDDKLLDNYSNFIKLFETTEYVNEKNADINLSSFKVKKLDLVYNKIKLFREFQTKYNIPNLCLDWKDNKINMDGLNEQEFENYKFCFRSTKSKPKTQKELKEFYAQMIIHIGGDLEIIKKSRPTVDGKKQTLYNFNIPEIQNIFKLVNNTITSENKLKKYDLQLLEKFDIKLTVKEKLTKNEENNLYLYGKKQIEHKDILKYVDANKIINSPLDN
jgi:hypothetical protein